MRNGKFEVGDRVRIKKFPMTGTVKSCYEIPLGALNQIEVLYNVCIDSGRANGKTLTFYETDLELIEDCGKVKVNFT